jgi:hypothetical protein
LPRDLSDVLHYFIPELTAEEESASSPAEVMPDVGTLAMPAPPAMRAQSVQPAALPIVGVPIGDRDVVRAAFTWNLSVEIARLGGRAVVLTPGLEDPSPLWPEAGIGPLGTELIQTPARDLASLYRVAIDTAVTRADGAAGGGLILVRIPPAWLRKAAEGAALLRWMLLFTSPDTRDLKETYGIAKLLLAAHPEAQVGITIHGARRRQEAEQAFSRLAHTTQKCLARDLLSYGLLVDDLDVYRAIVAQRPIGLAHPQSPAARALRDVAQILLDDARKRAVG